jgi:hypothetical protein
MRGRLLSILLGALALAGCGGSDLEFGKDASDLGYPDSADQICRSISSSFAAAQSQPPSSFEQAIELTDALLRIATEGEAELADVAAPPEDQEAFDRYLAARAEVVAELERARRAAEAEQADAYLEAREAANSGADERQRLAAAAGLRRCAEGEGR